MSGPVGRSANLEAELLALADANVREQWRLLAHAQPRGEVRTGRRTFHAITGLPFSFFNVAVVTEVPANPEKVIEDSDALFRSRGLAWCLRTRGDAAAVLEGPARRAGMRLDAMEAAMVLYPLPPAPPLAVPDLEIEDVVDVGTMERHLAVVSGAYGVADDVIASLLPPPLLLGSSFEAFLGSIDGVPASVSALVVTDQVAGVYNVGTLPVRRRRGLGTALTWHALEVGRRSGCTVGSLQSTVAGRTMYEAMGFRAIDTWSIWVSRPV